MKKDLKLSIIIPVYNEKNTILEVIKKVKEVQLKKEIIIVDDFSVDGTRDILSTIQDKEIQIILQEKNHGKGYAIRTGLKKARGEYIIIQDADLEYDPGEIKKLLEYAEKKKAPVVFGSRFFNKARSRYYHHFSFFLGNMIITKSANILYQCNLNDLETCYKLVNRDLINSLDLKSMKFEFEPEITTKILKKGIKIIELPITYNPRSITDGKKIRWRDGVDAIWVLVKNRFTH